MTRRRPRPSKRRPRRKADWKDPIVTEIVPLTKFYKAESYHQNYFNTNGAKNPYCSAVIRPKLVKLLHKGLIEEQPVK